MLNSLCKGSCGNKANYKGWCKVKWVSSNRFGVACPVIEEKRAKSIAKYRIQEAKLKKNPMQNSLICKKNHSPKRNKKAANSLRKLGKLGLLPQQIESKNLKEKRRKNVSKTLRRMALQGIHPRQLESKRSKKERNNKIAQTLKKLATENKLPIQNMSKEKKIKFAKKISKTLRRRIKEGKIKLSPSWKKVSYKSKYGGKIILRSNWEKIVAHFLDKNNIKWEYEAFTLSYFDTTRKLIANTIPDFWLPNYNLIIEVKSNAEYKSIKTKDKLKGIEKKGYQTFLIGKPEIDGISKNPTAILTQIGVNNEKS